MVEHGVGRGDFSLTGNLDCFRSRDPQSVHVVEGGEWVSAVPWTGVGRAWVPASAQTCIAG